MKAPWAYRVTAVIEVWDSAGMDCVRPTDGGAGRIHAVVSDAINRIPGLICSNTELTGDPELGAQMRGVSVEEALRQVAMEIDSEAAV